MSEIAARSTPEKKEILDDNARKFVVESIDTGFLSKNSPFSYLLAVDWLAVGEDTEEKIAYKKFDSGDIQILLISKVTINGSRTSEKKTITQTEYEKLLSGSILHLEKKRSEFDYLQKDVQYSLKFDEFAAGKLCILEIDADSAEKRSRFDPSDFPATMTEVTGDMQYYGYRMAEVIR